MLPNPIQKEKTVGNSIPNKFVFKKCFDELNVEKFRCPFKDHGAKKLLSGQTIVLMIEAQLQQRESLDDIAENLQSKEELQQYLNLESVHGSTIYRKLEKLPRDYLKSLYLQIVSHISSRHRKKLNLLDLGVLHIIDSSEVKLPNRAKWAYHQRHKNGVKAHTLLSVYDEETTLARNVITSTSAVSDQEAAIYLMNEDEGTYVFDRGYINYHHYHQWVKSSKNFVARVKASSKFKILNEQSFEEGSTISRDAEVQVKDPQTDEYFTLRLVEYLDDEKRTYRVVTNRWDLKAPDIAEIYRLRWRIELFFKWMKQHLQVKKWFNTKPEAVWNQLYIILIAYALCEWIKLLTDTSKTLWQILKKLRHYWFQSWSDFIEALNRQSTRTSKGRIKKRKRGRPRKHPIKYKAVKIINTI